LIARIQTIGMLHYFNIALHSHKQNARWIFV
jgi:hypothetical protein